MPKIVIDGSWTKVQAEVYNLATSREPMRLLHDYGYDFERAVAVIASNLGDCYVSSNRIILEPEACLMDHLRGRYEAAILDRLRVLGLGVEEDELRGLTAIVRPSWASSGQICRLASHSDGRSYDPARLIKKLKSVKEASFDSIWGQLESCETAR